MDTLTEKQALTNFAEKLGMTVHVYYPDDCRKKKLYYVALNGTSISPKLSYDKLNHFMLGWKRCIEQLKNQTNNN